jgi:hypothetical protein
MMVKGVRMMIEINHNGGKSRTNTIKPRIEDMFMT